MKIKLSWIGFVPLVFGLVLFRIYQVLFVDTNIQTTLMDTNTMNLIFGCGIVLLLVLTAIFSFADKKTAPTYEVGSNFLGGLFLLLAGVCIGADAGMTLMKSTANGVIDIAAIINGCISVLAAVAIACMGFVSITGKNFLKAHPVFMLVPPIWSCVRLIITFMSYTTIAVASKDVTDLIFMVFTTMFLYNAVMVFVGFPGKNSVKACFVYAMPAIATILAYTGALISRQVIAGTSLLTIENVKYLEYIFLALFMVFFLLELTSRAKSKDSVDEQPAIKAKKEKNEDVPEREPVKHTEEVSDVDAELSNTVRESLEEPKEEITDADRLAENILGKTGETEYIGYYDRDKKDKEDANSSNSSYGDRMDDIDKLILEISSEDQK